MAEEERGLKYEEVILGQMLNNNDVWHQAGLTSQHFIDPWCRTVFNTISSIIESGDEANIVTVTQAKTIPPSRNVFELTDIAIGDWKANADKVRQEARRHMLYLAAKTAAEKLEHGVDTEVVIGEIEDELVRIAMTGQDDVRLLTAGLHDYIEELERKYREQDDLGGISTGYTQLDKITGGFEEGRLWYLGARPSKGKSALLLNMMANVADKGIGCGLISLESSEREAYNRIISNKANVYSDSIRTGNFRPNDLVKIDSVVTGMKDWNVWVCDNPEMSASQVKAVARKMVIAHHVKILFIDYLQYIREDADDTLRRDHVAATSRSLKAIARQLNVPVVCAAQLRRDVEDRRSTWPRLGDFAESSQVEKDADVALLLHDEDDTVWWCIAKNRDGATVNIPATFDKEHLRFEENLGGSM